MSQQLAIETAKQAIRVIGKHYRRTFTDAIKELNEYVCPETGDCSTSGGRSYIAYTTTLYRRFGLSKDQAEAHLNGESIRDVVDSMTVTFIGSAELEAASLIFAGIKEKRPRKIIKQNMYDTFDRYADRLASVRSNFER